MPRDYYGKPADIKMEVVKQGVDLTIKQGKQRIKVELSQDDVVQLCANMLYRAGVNSLKVNRNRETGIGYSAHVSLAKKHPFPNEWNGTKS